MFTSEKLGWGVTLLALALFLTLTLPIEALSQTTQINTTPTVGIANSQVQSFSSSLKPSITLTRRDEPQKRLQYTDLCAGGTIKADCNNTEETFELSYQTCVYFEVTKGDDDCCNPPAECCVLMVDCGETAQEGWSLIRENWDCTASAQFYYCIGQGTYILSLDVCDCVEITAKAVSKPCNECIATNCH